MPRSHPAAAARRHLAEARAAGAGRPRRAGCRRARAQIRLRRLRSQRRGRGPARARDEGDVDRLQSGRRLSGAGGTGNRDRPAPRQYLADPRPRLGARDLVLGLQEAVHDRGAGDGLGRRDRPAHPDRVGGAGRAVVPGDGALRHAGGDRGAARGFLGQSRPVAGGRGRPGVRRAGGHRLRLRRRRQQAEGISGGDDGRQRFLELGQYRLHRERRGRRLPGVESRPTCWSI